MNYENLACDAGSRLPTTADRTRPPERSLADKLAEIESIADNIEHVMTAVYGDGGEKPCDPEPSSAMGLNHARAERAIRSLQVAREFANRLVSDMR